MQDISIQRQKEMSSFVIDTYKLLTASLFAATVGAYLGVQYNNILSSYYIPLIIVEFILLFGIMFSRKIPGLNLFLLFAFTTVSGLTLGPILTATLSMSNGAEIVSTAFLLTTIAFGSLTMFAMTTKTNFLGIGKYLFITLIVVVVASLLNLFFMSSLLSIVISGISAILFSFFIVYDTQRIYSGEFISPVDAALAMYLNILNLFIALLNILRTFSGRD